MISLAIGFVVVAVVGIVVNTQSVKTEPEKKYRDFENDPEFGNDYLD